MNIFRGLVDAKGFRSPLAARGLRIATADCPNQRRDGFILLIVILGIISAMALTYVVASTSYVNLRKVQNTGLRDSAKAAANTGLSVGLSRMFSSGWSGIGSTITATCGQNQAFQVTYEHGDPTLDPDSPEWPDFPYRVTIHAVGKAWHPDQPDLPAVCRKSWVVQLVPRAVPTEPTGWDNIVQHAFYQTAISQSWVNIPSQIVGRCRFQSTLGVARTYPTYDPRCVYFSDLYQIKANGYGEWRTFTGPVYFPLTMQTPVVMDLLVNRLRVSVHHQPSYVVSNDISIQKDLESYILYPNGKVYVIPSLGASLENTTLLPDVVENPAGIFYAPGNTAIRSNVTIRGSLFCNGDVNIEGTNINLGAQPLRGVQNDTPLELPTIVCKKLEFKDGAECEIRGMLSVLGEMKATRAQTKTNIQIRGRVFATSLKVDPLSPWESFDWNTALTQFNNEEDEEDEEDEEGNLTGEDRYFPFWLRRYGLDPTPRFSIQPPEDNSQYHWKRKDEPVYVPAASDTTPLDPQPGLRWEFVRQLDDQ